MPDLPPLPNQDLTAQLLRELKRNPDLSVADVEYDSAAKRYIFKRKDDGV